MLFTNNSLQKQLGLDFTNAKFSINIISAYVTLNACELLVESNKAKQVTKIVVGRFTPSDFISGASNIDALRFLLDHEVKVKALSNLHAKIYQIDNNTIYSGSANFTNNGLSLIRQGNLEATFKIPFDNQIDDFIQKVILGATDISVEVLNKMEFFIENFDPLKKQDIPMVWPSEIMLESSEIFISDFPFGKPGEVIKEYILNPSLTFAQIENKKDIYVEAQKIFKQSKAYKWIREQIKSNKSGRDLGFGKVSSLLHDALADDPRPYRQNIKNLQINFYSYLKHYANDEIEVYVPGNRSEVIREKNYET